MEEFVSDSNVTIMERNLDRSFFAWALPTMRLRISCMDDWAEDLSISKSPRLNHRVDRSSGVMAWAGGTFWRRWKVGMEAPKETRLRIYSRVDGVDIAVIIVVVVVVVVVAATATAG